MPYRARYLLLTPLLAALLAGCRGSQPDSASGPSAGPPAGAPGAPYTGTPSGTESATRSPAEVGTDAVMTGKVKNALITSKVDTGGLNVDTTNGTVTLKGSVPTAAQKSLAEKVAKQVAGVQTVKNELTVGAGK